MSIANTRSTLLVAALSVLAFAWQSGTAEAAKKGGASKRDAQIEQCLMKVNAEAPVVVPEGTRNRRVQIYKDCMVSAGMRP
jgi:hypothetical protein